MDFVLDTKVIPWILSGIIGVLLVEILALIYKDNTSSKKRVLERWLDKRRIASVVGLTVVGKINVIAYDHEYSEYTIISTLDNITSRSFIGEDGKLIKKDTVTDIIGQGCRCTVDRKYIYVETNNGVAMHRLEDFSFVRTKTRWMFVDDHTIVSLKDGGNTVVGIINSFMVGRTIQTYALNYSKRYHPSVDSIYPSMDFADSGLGVCHEHGIICLYSIDNHIFRTYQIVVYRVSYFEFLGISLFSS